MDEIEEVQKILKEVYWEEFDYSQPEWRKQGEEYFNDKTQQILALIKEAGYFQEEAELVARLIDRGWIPPEEAMKTGNAQ